MAIVREAQASAVKLPDDIVRALLGNRAERRGLDLLRSERERPKANPTIIPKAKRRRRR